MAAADSQLAPVGSCLWFLAGYAVPAGVSGARRGLRLLATLGWARPVPGHPYQAIRPALPRETADRP